MTSFRLLVALLCAGCSQSSTLLRPVPVDGALADGALPDGALPDGATSDAGFGPSPGSPTLSNFRAEDPDTQRIWFDSSEPLVGSSSAGFLVSDGDVTGVVINPDATTGHYFVLAAPVTYWDNLTLRYEGQTSDLRDRDESPVLDFRMQYVRNQLAEPALPGLVYFVSLSGDDASDGLSEASAWRTLGFALSNASPVRSGDIVYVQAGDYGAEEVVSRKNADANETDAPIVVEGYRDTPGDAPDLGWSYPAQPELDAMAMPLLRGTGTGTGLEIRGDNFIVRNLQITNYGTGVFVTSAPHRVVLSQLIVTDTAPAQFAFLFNSDAGRSNRILRSVAFNAGTALIRFYGSHSMIDRVDCVQDANPGGGSYVETRGDNNIVRRTRLEHAIDAGSSGQGLNVKGAGVSTQYGLFEELRVVGIKASIGAAHSEVRYNVYRDIDISRGPAVAQENTGGIVITNGASFNVFERIRVDGVGDAIDLVPGTEDAAAPSGPNHNLIVNSVFSGCSRAVMIGGGLERPTHDNRIVNSTFHDVGRMFARFDSPVLGNQVSGCQLVNIAESGATDGFVFDHGNFFGSWATPPGEQNIAVDPRFIDAATRDFRLGADSPESVRSGALTPARARYDHDWAERTVGACSIGAFEAP